MAGRHLASAREIGVGHRDQTAPLQIGVDPSVMLAEMPHADHGDPEGPLAP